MTDVGEGEMDYRTIRNFSLHYCKIVEKQFYKIVKKRVIVQILGHNSLQIIFRIGEFY